MVKGFCFFSKLKMIQYTSAVHGIFHLRHSADLFCYGLEQLARFCSVRGRDWPWTAAVHQKLATSCAEEQGVLVGVLGALRGEKTVVSRVIQGSTEDGTVILRLWGKDSPNDILTYWDYVIHEYKWMNTWTICYLSCLNVFRYLFDIVSFLN